MIPFLSFTLVAAIVIMILSCSTNSFWILIPIGLLIAFTDQALPLILSVFFILLIPIFWARFQENSHQKRLNNDLPSLLESISSSLKIGQTLESSFQRASEETSGPLLKMCQEVLHRMSLGSSLEDSLTHEARHWHSSLLTHFIQAVKMSRDSGLDAGKLFSSLASNSREEAHISERLMSMSAQGRLQAWILSLMPFALLGIMTLFDPLRIQSFFEDTRGKILLFVMVILEMIGLIWIKRLIRL